MSFFKSIGAAWQSIQDTVAPPPPDQESAANPAPADPYAALYERHVAAEGGFTAAAPTTGPAAQQAQIAPGKADPIATAQSSSSVAFFTPGAAAASSGAAGSRRAARLPAKRYVPVDDGFGSTAGHADRGAKYGNHVQSAADDNLGAIGTNKLTAGGAVPPTQYAHGQPPAAGGTVPPTQFAHGQPPAAGGAVPPTQYAHGQPPAAGGAVPPTQYAHGQPPAAGGAVPPTQYAHGQLPAAGGAVPPTQYAHGQLPAAGGAFLS